MTNTRNRKEDIKNIIESMISILGIIGMTLILNSKNPILTFFIVAGISIITGGAFTIMYLKITRK